MKKTYILLVLVFILSVLPCCAYAIEPPENISVSDYAGVMTDSSKSYIDSKNDILFAAAQAKIVFVTVNSTDGMSISDYTDLLYKEWGIASIGRRNSVFVVIDTQKREYDFVQGKNIHLSLTDTVVYDCLIQSFEPFFSVGEDNKAILSLYNALASWYESHYTNLTLNLDSNIDSYLYGEKTPDKMIIKNYTWIWITAIVCLVLLIIVLKIKRNIELKIRQHERRRLKKKFQIDIDKIVNS